MRQYHRATQPHELVGPAIWLETPAGRRGQGNSERSGCVECDTMPVLMVAGDAGEDERAFGIYLDMVRRLEGRWFRPAAAAAAS